ncbi:MAG: ferredoxin-type protein NapF [Campylobacterota bacterium]|nr:ferredoxin-type protein NapF [Campylobacterota bacterium]
MKRRELFSSLASPFKNNEDELEAIIRPPYFKNESDFIKSCVTCEEKSCTVVCEENIIVIGEDGTPSLNFANSGCTYCDECAIACKDDVLKVENKKNINVKFSIDLLKCMSWNQTMCFSCKDPCLDDAIKFLGMFRPEINNDLCTSCGFCVKVCPSDAISLEIINKEEIV